MAGKFAGGPVGLSTLAVALGEDPGTLEEVYEPYLIQQGLIQRTPRGRMLTARGRRALGLPELAGDPASPADQQLFD
jgi:Holliday junction DNA helicase RuvB